MKNEIIVGKITAINGEKATVYFEEFDIEDEVLLCSDLAENDVENKIISVGSYALIAYDTFGNPFLLKSFFSQQNQRVMDNNQFGVQYSDGSKEYYDKADKSKTMQTTGLIKLGDNPTDWAVKYNELVTLFDSLKTWLNTHVHGVVSLGNPTSPAATPVEIITTTLKSEQIKIK